MSKTNVVLINGKEPDCIDLQFRLVVKDVGISVRDYADDLDDLEKHSDNQSIGTFLKQLAGLIRNS